MRLILFLMCATLVVSDGYAQKPKTKVTKKSKKPAPAADVWEAYPELVTTKIEQTADVAIEIKVAPQPEPLIGIHYLLAYPKEAVEGKVQGTVTYTVKVRDGKVIDAKIERPDNMYLTSSVLEAAHKLQFDRSWHAPDKPEFYYSREVEFLLPDIIRSIPAPTLTTDIIYRTP